MDELLVGIATHFAQKKNAVYHAFYTDIGGKLRDGVPRDSDSTEYGTLNFPNDADASMMDNRRHEVLTQFDLYSHAKSSEAIGILYKNLKSWFDDCEAIKDGWAALTVSGFRVQLVDRINAFRFSPDLEADGENAYWRISVRYLITLLKN